jgi:hypothetical protein
MRKTQEIAFQFTRLGRGLLQNFISRKSRAIVQAAGTRLVCLALFEGHHDSATTPHLLSQTLPLPGRVHHAAYQTIPNPSCHIPVDST